MEVFKRIKIEIKKLVRKVTPNFIINEVINDRLEHVNLSYSQEGEDLILGRIFERKANGFYIDIGAHHPKRFSNTYKFYLRGWRGMNIDALPGTKALFDKERPLDINVEIGVSKSPSNLVYYLFNEPALNTFDKSEAENKHGKNGYFIQKEIIQKTLPLSDILSQYLTIDTEIDFMSSDVEGLDLEVLESNDWAKYRPNYILIEELRTDIEIILNESKVYEFLNVHGYKLFHRTFNTSFYCSSFNNP